MRPAAPLFLLAALAFAQDTGRPRFNTSYIAASPDQTAALVARATAAAENDDADGAADRLQVLLIDAPPGLVPIRPNLLYVSPRRWAQIQLLAERAPFGPKVLAAWRKFHDREASALLRAAIRTHDDGALLRLLDRHPAATAAPAALLALCDRALLRGDPEAARGYLLRLPEHLARSEEAAFLASPAYRARADHLARLAPRRPAGWPTLGGDASRARNGDALPKGELVARWATPVLELWPDALGSVDDDREHSPMLPFYPTCDERHVYVHCVTAVAGIDRTTGRLKFFAPDGALPDSDIVDQALHRNPGVRAATVVDGVLYFNRVLPDDGGLHPRRTNALVAFDVAAGRTAWQVRQSTRYKDTCPPLTREVFFRGAPAVVGDRLYVCGAVRDMGDDGRTRKEEGYLFCFARDSGRPLWHRFLGSGTTIAAPDFPPLSGLPVAAARGVVVAVTGFGVAAAADGRTGEILWLLRYDRKTPDDTVRLADVVQEKTVLFKSTWMREPPRIAGDAVYFAPFDAKEMFACWLRGARARDGAYTVEQWAKARDSGHGNHSHLETVAGIAGGRIYYVGRRDARPEFTAGYKTVVSHPLDRTVGWSAGLVPAIDLDRATGLKVPPEVFGRPCIAGDILLVPTREVIFRFAAGRDAVVTKDPQGEMMREIPYLPPYLAPAPADEAGVPGPAFGTLVAHGGVLLTATGDRVICYVPKK